MKRFLSLHGRTLAFAAVLVPLLALFAWVAVRSGPLAPVPVTVAAVERRAIAPGLFGIGTVEARYTHRIGPTFPGRLGRVEVQPGDRVTAGQLLGEMDPVDLDEKVGAQQAALRRAESGVLALEAQVREVGARHAFAKAQADRYDQLFATRSVSREAVEAKRQEFQVAQSALAAVRAGLEGVRQDRNRVHAERAGASRQRANLRLVAPVDGIVTRRDADPGTTVVAGQSVLEIVASDSVWISARFDQQRATGLRAGLPARIVLRSRTGDALAGHIARIEPHADPVTEESLAKVDFDQRPLPLPSIGEQVEVTVTLPAQQAMPVVLNASVQRVDGRLGVWVVDDGRLRFVAVRTGATDLDGRVQILDGLAGGERVVVYSRKALDAGSRIEVVERIVDRPR
jgi:RND family efflux transporter MFP subunit